MNLQRSTVGYWGLNLIDIWGQRYLGDRGRQKWGLVSKMGSGLAMKHPAAICSSVDVSLQDPQPGYLFK